MKSLFLNKIITQDIETKKSKWFFAIHRKLCMYISWIKFAKLKIKINVKTISIKHWVSQFDFFRVWLRLIYEKKNIIMKIKVEKLLALACQDALKLRVLLMTLKIQIDKVFVDTFFFYFFISSLSVYNRNDYDTD